jgi:hypothetical protein
MSSPAGTLNDSPTLAYRLSSGKLPASEALRYAMLLAESLRKLHDAGRCHGSLTPDHILLIGGGLELLPATALPAAGPYTAPELLQGQTPDARSDTFSLGTILFEMFTGRRAFDDGNTDAAAPSSGSPAVDKLLRTCLLRDPAVRCQRLQKLMMELKLLIVAVRRAEGPAPARAQATETALRAEMAQLEARLAARLESQETGLSVLEQGATTALAGFRGQLTAVGAQLDTVETRLAAQDESAAVRAAALQQFEARLAEAQTAAAAEANSAAQAAMLQLEGRVNERLCAIERAAENITVLQNQISDAVSQAAATSERAAARIEALAESVEARLQILEQARGAEQEWCGRIEASIEAFDKDGAALRDSVTNDLRGYDRTLKNHASSIDSARTAIAQTDDLVERVVEALEALQSTILESK